MLVSDHHLLRYFGDTNLAAIMTIGVIDLTADMPGRSCSPAYINDAVRVLKMLLRRTLERDVIAGCPLKRRVPKRKERIFGRSSTLRSVSASSPRERTDT
jgi:hypothetical protein